LADAFDPGTAGASARREFERRKAKHEERIRTKHPKLGGLILAITDEKQDTKTWDVGAFGEEKLGRGLSPDPPIGGWVERVVKRECPCGAGGLDLRQFDPTGSEGASDKCKHRTRHPPFSMTRT
jgi:hypothetical protein